MPVIIPHPARQEDPTAWTKPTLKILENIPISPTCNILLSLEAPTAGRYPNEEHRSVGIKLVDTRFQYVPKGSADDSRSSGQD